jgi:hypothetical protein
MSFTINKGPDWKGYSTIPSIEFELPKSWQGLSIDWKTDSHVIPVFIAQFEIPGLRADVYVYGARFETSNAMLNDKELPPGFFIEYKVVEIEEPDHIEIMHLSQHRGITYNDHGSKNDHVPASEVNWSDALKLSFNSPPRWKVEDAHWPTHKGNLMEFVGQVDLIENEVTKKLLTWNKRIFLFRAKLSEKATYKIITQDLDYQSSEDHYLIES